MTITHVCLSDLHFGAETSLLTELGEDYQPRYQQASPVLLRLIACLRELIAAQSEAPRPTLVLAGDVLELALSQANQASMTFETFLSLAFPGGKDDLFAREIIYIPGNHDHHLWEMARETHYLDYLNTVPAGDPIGEEWHITRLYRQDGVGYPEMRLLTGLAHRHPSLRDLHVATAYPNMGIRSADGRRSVVFMHGHYVEPLYTLISDLKRMIFPEQEFPDTVLEFEAENFAWIDFFWSTMGRSGAAGEDVQRIYEMIGTTAGRERLSTRLAAGVVERFFSDDWVPDAVQRVAFDKLFDVVFRRAVSRERGRTNEPLGKDAQDGLDRYLAGPLRRQIAHECRNTRQPEFLTVIFGHTHKPFEQTRPIDGFSQGIDVYNTGGWVVDTVQRQALHGAAAVLVDEHCHCASLRFYNEVSDGGAPTAVRVAALRPTPLSAFLDAQVDGNRDPWSTFSEIVAAAIEARAEALDRRGR